MLPTIFQEMQGHLDHFFSAVDFAAIQTVFDRIQRCTGTVILSGVGKSGHIAQKIAMTLVSTGTRALFLSPSQALHGDIGIVSPQDCFLGLSKSGASQELLDLLPHIQKRGAFTIAVVSDRFAPLAKISDFSIHLPVRKEICPHDLAPTTSTTVQLIFGDCLAVALMRAKQFAVEEFAANHPAGLLGRKITLKVSDLMLQGDAIPLCYARDPLIGVLHELTAKRCGSVLITDEKRSLIGIFTDGDLRRAIEAEGERALHKPMEQFMTRSPRIVAPDLLALAALRQMEENPNRLVTVLPVLERNNIVGILRMHDILQAGLR
ncbi:MAG: KpsF/GutQ family sugar-phosphate isomerase [Chlamydiia bacterium]|nr:KpsF/GutQ family sugar-phosphate isomerase [Chlamydiia bacterium]